MQRRENPEKSTSGNKTRKQCYYYYVRLFAIVVVLSVSEVASRYIVILGVSYIVVSMERGRTVPDMLLEVYVQV